MPLVQQAFAQGQTKKLVDDLLNDSLRILDICGIAQNALLQIKESVQGLLSVLRRRGAPGGGGGGMAPVGGVEFGRHGQQMLLSVNEEHVSMLKEVSAVILALFESLLSHILGPKTTS